MGIHPKVMNKTVAASGHTMPPKLFLKVTNRCNLRCPHCFAGDYEGDMPLSVVHATAKRYGTFRRIIYFGGEPTLMGVDYIMETINIFKAKGYLMQSNLIERPDDAFVQLLREHFCGRVGTSFDVGRLPHASRLLDNVHLLSEQGIKVSVIITLTNDITIGEVKGFIESFRERGGSGFFLNTLRPVKMQVVDADHYLELFKDLLCHPMNITAKRIGTALSGCSGSGLPLHGGNCAEKGVRTIDPDGTVYICPDFAGQKIFPLGNVNDPDFDDGPANLNNRIYYERELNLSLSCSNCEFWNLCRGGCVSATYFSKLDCLISKDPGCHAFKEMLSHV